MLCVGCRHPGGQHVLDGGCRLCPNCPGWGEHQGVHGYWNDQMTFDLGGETTPPLAVMSTRVVHVPYTIEQDEDGAWCAAAVLRQGVAAFGVGATREAAIADLRSGLTLLIEEVGVPDLMEITLSSDAPVAGRPAG
jgi:predicted RNase H-like HicB family nuclease